MAPALSGGHNGTYCKWDTLWASVHPGNCVKRIVNDYAVGKLVCFSQRFD